MKIVKIFLVLSIIFLSFTLQNDSKKIVKDIELPAGFIRLKLPVGSFSEYLRNFPLSANDTIYDYQGNKLWDQEHHIAVLDIDVGKQDLQQCADAVMRLRAEYLYKYEKYNEIHFNFLSDGKPRYYVDYTNDRSYKKFRSYMNYIFSYANTASLKNEMKSVDIKDIMPGDVFIQSGNPYGHAVIVVDVAFNVNTGEKIFLLAQSFMPAQSIHILKNLENNKLSPWFSTKFEEALYTPCWVFKKTDLKRF